MKYGSASAGMAAAAAVTSNGGGIYEQQSGVISGGGQAVMFAVSQQQQQQQMESQQQQQQQQQSSVIKTAPPGRNSAQMLIDFSPKQEPIDLAPLTSAHPCLQDLGKMSVGSAHLEHYYASMNGVSSSQQQQQQAVAKVNYAGPYYEYMNLGSAAAYGQQQAGGSSASSLLQPAAAAVVALGGGIGGGVNGLQQQQQQQHAQHQDWPYMTYNTHHQQQQQQQQQQLGYLSQLDSCAHQLGLDQQRIYKNGLNGVENGGGGGGLLSPVDSGIGQEMLLEQAKQQLHEFFGPVSLASTASILLPQQPGSQSSVIHQHHAQQQEPGQPGGSQQQQQQRQRSAELQQQQQGGGQPQRVHEPREQSIPVVIPKLDNPLGFQYTLESPISTSIRREDDRMTYVNKGQFYTVSLDYLPDLRCPLKGLTVRSQVMVVFREDKSYDEELRTWLVWYKRQHSPKQRIIEVDTKNSMGAIGGHYEEIAHNAVQFCWNPGEQPSPKVSIAVQCLSTDFSTQKGVKGLPLHIQIDTYDDQADSKQPFHRGYCQIKVFCDKGAERKLRDEDKRAHRRKNNTGGGGTATSTPQPTSPTITTSMMLATNNNNNSGSGGGGGGRKKLDCEFHEQCERSHFYHSADLDRPAALFVPSDDFFFDTASIGSYEALSELEPQPKRPRPSERIMIYVRKADEDVFTPLHLVPPSLGGLARAISEKYNLDESKIEAFYKQCQKGITVKIDDDMLRHYSNQDTFLLELKQSELDRHTFYSVTLVELHSANNAIGHQSQTPSATSSSSTTSEPAPPSGSMATANGQQQQQQQQQRAIW